MEGNAMPKEDRRAVDMAIGRLFRMASRPSRPGDAEEYARIRSVAMGALPLGQEPDMGRPLPGWNFGKGVSGCIE